MPRQAFLPVLADVARAVAPDPRLDPSARRSALERWASTLPGASPAMRRFLGFLAPLSARNRDLEAFPHQETIAAALGCKVRAVQYLVARARVHGWLEVQGRAHGRGNVYRLLPPWSSARQLELETQELRLAEGRICGSLSLLREVSENARPRPREAPAPSSGHPCPDEPANPPKGRASCPAERSASRAVDGGDWKRRGAALGGRKAPLRRSAEGHGCNPSRDSRCTSGDGAISSAEARLRARSPREDAPMPRVLSPEYLAFKAAGTAIKEGRSPTPAPDPPAPACDTVRRTWTTPCTHAGCTGKVRWRRYDDRTESECERRYWHD